MKIVVSTSVILSKAKDLEAKCLPIDYRFVKGSIADRELVNKLVAELTGCWS